MKKIIISICVVFSWLACKIEAQTTALRALNYQAVALDEQGQAIKSQKVWLRLSLSSKDKTTSLHYSEIHQVLTDFTGAFDVKIGRGKPQEGKWQEVPWASKAIWMQVELSKSHHNTFQLLSDKQLLAVPYALYANTTNQIDPKTLDLEKSQSIYWNTAGNSGTKPSTHFLGTTDNKNLVFRSNNIPHMTLTTEGKLELNTKIAAGVKTSKDAYPVVIEGSTNTQGLWIKVNGSRSSANNFMTFRDALGTQGRIEGQTLSELEGSEIYQTQAALFALSVASTTAEIIALTIEYPFKLKSGWSTPSAIAVGYKIGNLIAKGIALTTAYTLWVERIRRKVGVAFKSGNGDYAEALPRKKGTRDLFFGEVVGIKNGEISLSTDSSDHIMVVSKAPIINGNMPQPEHEDQYEKVAFMGQVPVRVAGPVAINDYILPSGNNDGFAIAVHPQDMKTLDYGKILGIAWETGDNNILNIVNVAVGINSNDLAPRVQALAEKLDKIESYLSIQKMAGNGMAAPLSLQNNRTNYQKLLPDGEFDQFIDGHAVQIEGLYQEIKTRLDAEGIDFQSNTHLVELFNDPIKVTKKLRRNPKFATQWGMIDQQILAKKK